MKKYFLAILVVGFTFSLSIYIGYRVGSDGDNDLYYKLRHLDEIIAAALPAKKSESTGKQLETRAITTTLVELELTKAQINAVRTEFDGLYDHSGGAITNYKDNLLVVDALGNFFVGASLDEGFQQLQIDAPEVNKDRYEFFKESEQYSGITFQKTPLKFNDLLYLESENTVPSLYLTYTRFDEIEPCFRVVLAKVNVPNGIESLNVGSGDWKTVYQSEPCLPLMGNGYKAMFGEMAGGKMLYKAPSTMLIALGDFEYKDIAQDQKADYGKIISVDLLTGGSNIYASGLRNPKGLIETLAGQTLVVGNGPRGGDEINVVEKGQNFGWPIESYGTTYFGDATIWSNSFGRHDKYTKPLFSWVPSIAPSGILELQNLNDAWDGDLLVSSLRAESLFRIRRDGGRIAYVEAIPIGVRIRDMAQFDGNIVLYTDEAELIYIALSDIKIYKDLSSRFLKKNPDVDPVRFNGSITVCQQCHSLFGNDNSRAPGLQNVYLDPVATTPYANYSSALKGVDKVWDEELLKQFLSNPQSVAPGTAMPAPGLESEEDIEAVIDFLKYLDSRI